MHKFVPMTIKTKTMVLYSNNIDRSSVCERCYHKQQGRDSLFFIEVKYKIHCHLDNYYYLQCFFDIFHICFFVQQYLLMSILYWYKITSIVIWRQKKCFGKRVLAQIFHWNDRLLYHHAGCIRALWKYHARHRPILFLHWYNYNFRTIVDRK